MSVVSRLLLTDSTMPVNFCKAGANCALAMLTYLGESLYMVAEVREELERKAEVDGSPALRRFLDKFPGERVWRRCFTNRERWAGFRERVGRECPNMLP